MKTYAIAEMAREFGCTHRALRFWEDKGLIAPKRGEGLTRLYSDADRDRIAALAHLRRAGVPLDEVRAALKREEWPARRAAMRAAVDARIKELRAQLQAAEDVRAELSAKSTAPRP